MKIAIQGHPTRGREVIQILESLGGENRYDESCSNEKFVYFINSIGFIFSVTQSMCSNERRIYTLEEFENEFPFKIGDKVITNNDCIGIVEKLIPEHISAYCVNTGNVSYWSTPSALRLYREMKKERNVTLTLDKAKEWYKKGGELREVALQAFTEKELNSLPRSWEEFCRDNPVKTSEAVICTESTIVTCDCSEIRDSDCDREICPSIKSAEAHLAMIQLEQLRNCWWNGWEPIWDASTKYIIKRNHNEIHVIHAYNVSAFLVFPTREMAEEFLECFRDLIEKARDLI